MAKIYILLMQTFTIPARLIRLCTNYEYSHVALSLDKNCDVLYSFGRRKVNSIWNGGFTKELKTGPFFHKFANTKCIIYELTITNEQYKKIEMILKKMSQEENKYKYDFLGLIVRCIGIPLTIKNHYVCSFFVAELLKKVQVINLDKKPCLVKPKDFANYLKNKEIYVGNYVTYNN